MFTDFKQGFCGLRFETFTEAVKYADANKSASEAATRTGERGYTDSNWSGSKTFEECVERCRKGFPKGRKQIETFKAFLDGKLESAHAARQEVYFDVVGSGGYDMGTVLTGVPECALEWVDTQVMEKRQSNQGKVIKFLVNLSASWSVSAEVLAMRGAVVGAMVDCLEHEGYSVEVETVVTCTHRAYYDRSEGGYFDIRVPIKKAGQHMSLDQLASSLVNVAFFRRIGFVHIAKCGPIGYAAANGGSYGTPRDVDPDTLTAEQVDLYFPQAHGYEVQWNSKEAALEWITTQLKLFGINLTETKVKKK